MHLRWVIDNSKKGQFVTVSTKTLSFATLQQKNDYPDWLLDWLLDAAQVFLNKLNFKKCVLYYARPNLIVLPYKSLLKNL